MYPGVYRNRIFRDSQDLAESYRKFKRLFIELRHRARPVRGLSSGVGRTGSNSGADSNSGPVIPERGERLRARARSDIKRCLPEHRHFVTMKDPVHISPITRPHERLFIFVPLRSFSHRNEKLNGTFLCPKPENTENGSSSSMTKPTSAIHCS